MRFRIGNIFVTKGSFGKAMSGRVSGMDFGGCGFLGGSIW